MSRRWCAAALLAGCAAGPRYAADARPLQTIDPGRHPNLAAAQRLSAEAYEHLLAAQRANDWDMGGHAQAAKTLLIEANEEMKAAALAANRR